MQKEDAVPSDIFPHVYSFLVRFGFLKSAKLFRKEANVPRVVVDTPGLLDFYEAFKKRKKKVVDALQTEETVASKKKRKLEKQLSKEVLKKKKKKQSSSSEYSSSEEEQKTVGQSSKKSTNIDSSKKKKQTDTKPAEEESSSSPSDSEPAKTNGLQGGASSGVLPKHKKIAAAVKKSASSSSEDSSSEDDHVKPVLSTAKQSQEDEDDSSSSDSDTPATKQPIAIAQPHTVPKANKKSKGKATINQPFCRVNKQTSVNPKLADNSFEAKSGARGSWGEKAHHVLKNTKGRSFRHEKTKKKRGSYTGGRIDTGVHSIKFDNSD